MRRSGYLKRTSPLRKRKCDLRPAKAIPRKKRTPSEKLRVYGSPQRIAWMHASPCVITGRFPCEVVHVKTGGMSRKAGCEWTVPMIPELHRELHAIGIRSFEQRYCVDLESLAVETEARWNAR